MVINFPDNDLTSGALRLADLLHRHGYGAWLVGGSVRDALLSKPIKDIDLATTATPDQVRELFSHTVEVGAAFGIIVVVENGYNYEIATLREEREYADGRHPETVTYTTSPELDAARRDFTINAMFYDPAADRLLDFFGGREDLRLGVLRTVGDPACRFREDYLRMMRAVRFASRFGFALDPAALAVIRDLKSKVAGLSFERICAELDAMLTGPDPAGAIRLLHHTGLLAEVLPEVAAMDGVEQPPLFHPEGDVLTHTLLMLEHLGAPDSDLAWSVLLHDIGKPSTRLIGADGLAHFYTHEEVGAQMAEELLRRLRFPRRNLVRIVHAVRNHMRFAQVDKMKKSTWRRLLAEPDFPLELELHRIDCTSSHGLLQNYVLLLDRAAEVSAELPLPDPLLTGRDLLALGMKPGPAVGELLHWVRDQQLEGKLSSVEEALAAVRSRLNV